MPETINEIRQRVKIAQKNYKSNIRVIESILQHERRYVTKAPLNDDVVILMSGGLDSTVMAEYVIDKWNAKIHPLFLRRGARSEKYEEKAFDFFIDFFRKKHPENMYAPFKINIDVPIKKIKAALPGPLALTTGHPLRNSTIQNVAVMYAISLQTQGYNVNTIFSGSIGDDSTEPELGLLSLRSQTLNTCIHLGDWNWQITSPFTDPELTLDNQPLFKNDLIKYASEQAIPIEKTRTCFSSKELADGTCNACIKRLEAFRYLNLEDPINYSGGNNGKSS